MAPNPTPAKVLQIDNKHAVIVDADLYDELAAFKWYLRRRRRSYYAYRLVNPPKRSPVRLMSHFVAQTPPGMICHHRNRNSLDNCRSNLLNMTRKTHDFLHANDSLLIRFEEITGEKPDCAHRLLT